MDTNAIEKNDTRVRTTISDAYVNAMLDQMTKDSDESCRAKIATDILRKHFHFLEFQRSQAMRTPSETYASAVGAPN